MPTESTQPIIKLTSSKCSEGCRSFRLKTGLGGENLAYSDAKQEYEAIPVINSFGDLERLGGNLTRVNNKAFFDHSPYSGTSLEEKLSRI